MRKYLAGSICLLALALPVSEAVGTEMPDTASCSAAGPQSPRDIGQSSGSNRVTFSTAPAASEMHLCDIHFHKFAEHKAREYSSLAGEGDHAGFVCEGREPQATGESERESGAGGCGNVGPGDTVEVHWVFTTCEVEPAPTLASCFSAACTNPQLRVEAKVFYLTAGGKGALDFAEFAAEDGGRLPSARRAVEYLGSTTGTSFSNGTCSPFQVTWNVRPTCSPLELASLDAWCEDNVFDEVEAHGVRELVTSLRLLSRID